MDNVDDLIQCITTEDDRVLRRKLFELPGRGPTPGPAYGHQLAALQRIEAGAAREPPVSGIVHFPTGAGKTRVGLELVAVRAPAG